MKPWRWSIFIVCLLPAAAGLGQVDPDPDGIGMYADLDATVTSISAEPGEFCVENSHFDSNGDGLPLYIPWRADPGIFIPLHPYPDGPGEPSFAVNPTMTPLAAGSWGGVKALFRD